MAEVPTIYHVQDSNIPNKKQNMIPTFVTKNNFTAINIWKLEQTTKGEKYKLF